MHRYTLCLSTVFLLVSAASSFAADGPPVDFTRDIRPILSNHCFHCHGPDAATRKGELRLDTKSGAISKSGDAHIILPGKPEKSELLRRITAIDADERMPPKSEKRSLSKKQIDLIRRWIAQGANWEKHWSFIPPKRPAVPRVKNAHQVNNPIDAFIIARQSRRAASQSRPVAPGRIAPEASKTTLIRRVTLDLTGLPPTLAEVDAFLADKSPDAYEKVVDRLLASPAYGERMAWPWLDAGRYADTNGFQGDPERTMWPWRDWLVRALNDNKPFDEFTIEMLAGDLIASTQRSPDGSRLNGRARERLNKIIATGFNRNHMINGEGGRIAEETRVENVFDRTETTATVWMGLTMTCCRCHDHKYDPISNREYYRLYAFFNNTSEDGRGRSGQAKPNVSYMPRDAERASEKVNRQVQLFANEVAKFERGQTPKPKKDKFWRMIVATLKKKPIQRDVKSLTTLVNYFNRRAPRYAGVLDRLRQAKIQQERVRKQSVRVMVMDEMKKRRPTFILNRGTYNKPTKKVTRGTPSFLPPLPNTKDPNRLTLAKWLMDPQHPLTARVTVNRYWQLFFGVGLVKTAEDFGIQGERPTHPQLLDWLATEFIHSGWNVKQMHRLIVTSATYRQSSKAGRVQPTGSRRTQPAGFYTKFPRRRMPSWMIRDQALAISGLSNRKLGGPPVFPYQPAGVWAEATFGKKRYRQSHGDKLYRRSLYIFWRRIVGPTMFFDSGDRQTCTVIPSRTNTPLHALTTLNDTTYVEAARGFAERVLKSAPASKANSSHQLIKHAFRLATSRYPNKNELLILATRYERLRRQYKANPTAAAELLKVGEHPRDESLNPVDHAAMTGVCLLILNLDEVLSRE